MFSLNLKKNQKENEKLQINYEVISTLRKSFRNICEGLDMEEETKKHIKFEEKKEKKEYFYKGIEDYLKDISSTDYDNMINKYEPFKFEIEEKKKRFKSRRSISICSKWF